MVTAGDAVGTMEANPKTGKQIEGGTANFIYRSDTTNLRCQLHYHPPPSPQKQKKQSDWRTEIGGNKAGSVCV